VPIAPIFEVGAFDPLIEGPHGWSAMDLVIHFFRWITAKSQTVRVNKVPSEDQGHLLFRITFRSLDDLGQNAKIILLRFSEDLSE
jgi:hypothetical protein